MESPRILLIGEIASLLRVSISTINRYLRQTRKGCGNFPLPISPKGSKGRWLSSDIERYIETQSKADLPMNVVGSSKREQQDARSIQRRNELAKAVLAKHAASRHKTK